MLKRLQIDNFKSFDHTELALAPVTVLVGANATGKSNLLDAIRFLHGLSSGVALADVLRGHWEGGREVWSGIRGGAVEAVRKGQTSFALNSAWELPPDAGGMLDYRIECRVDPQPTVKAERLTAAGEGYYLFDTQANRILATDTLRPNDAIYVPVRGDGSGGGPVCTVSASRTVLSQIHPVSRIHESVLPAVEAMRSALKNMLFLDISPRLMRDYVPKQMDQIGTSGQNVSAILFRECQDPERRLDIIDWVSEVCAPALLDIGFVETDLGDVLFQLVETGDVRISARSVSDGTLRFLGELVALKTAPAGSLVLMEEIENGLHPSRVHLLVELIEAVAAEREIQVIATTHSPQVLQALSREALEGAIVFGRVPEQSATVARSMGALPYFEDILKKRPIDELFTTRWLERAL